MISNNSLTQHIYQITHQNISKLQQLHQQHRMIRFSYILAGLGVGIYAIPPVRRRFDEKIFKHVRNYGATLGQWNKFNTQEEFYEMLTNVGGGVTTFFSD